MVLVGSTVETLQFSKGSREDSARFSCASREFLSRSSWRPFSKAVKCRILMSTTSRFPFIRSELAFTAAQREPAVSLLVCWHSLHGKMSELHLDFHSPYHHFHFSPKSSLLSPLMQKSLGCSHPFTPVCFLAL